MTNTMICLFVLGFAQVIMCNPDDASNVKSAAGAGALSVGGGLDVGHKGVNANLFGSVAAALLSQLGFKTIDASGIANGAVNAGLSQNGATLNGVVDVLKKVIISKDH